MVGGAAVADHEVCELDFTDDEPASLIVVSGTVPTDATFTISGGGSGWTYLGTVSKSFTITHAMNGTLYYNYTTNTVTPGGGTP